MEVGSRRDFGAVGHCEMRHRLIDELEAKKKKDASAARERQRRTKGNVAVLISGHGGAGKGDRGGQKKKKDLSG